MFARTANWYTKIKVAEPRVERIAHPLVALTGKEKIEFDERAHGLAIGESCQRREIEA